MTKQWVQHMSGQGEKWEISQEYEDSWSVNRKTVLSVARHWLPKSEYRLCTPPEVWKDVTEECVASTNAALAVHHRGKVCTHGGVGYPEVYKLRKVKIELYHEGRSFWAFIVEQKVTE